MDPGTLFVVGVPIGNLEDITLRALRVLREATVIACEDTRETGRLLSLLGVARPNLVALHDYNEAQRSDGLVDRMLGGESVVLVSDAGTPAVSDPGYKLVSAAVAADLSVVPIPGPCAAIVALCAAGLPTDRFRFIGFVPSKAEARRQVLQELADDADTLVFYESPHRLVAFLEAAAGVFGNDRPAVIARELTKKFEEFRRGTLGELVAEPGVVRGEVVVLVGGAPEAEAPTAADLEGVVRQLLAEGWSASRAAKEAAVRTGVARRVAYALALQLTEGT